jgi:hypothetical protein
MRPAPPSPPATEPTGMHAGAPRVGTDTRILQYSMLHAKPDQGFATTWAASGRRDECDIQPVITGSLSHSAAALTLLRVGTVSWRCSLPACPAVGCRRAGGLPNGPIGLDQPSKKHHGMTPRCYLPLCWAHERPRLTDDGEEASAVGE